MARGFFIPENYFPKLSVKNTEYAIKKVKDMFESSLALELNLQRVTAPLFVPKGTGINDDLNGIEKPVSFCVSDMQGIEAEIVQSLAKWKRLALKELSIQAGRGLYTDMNAIRPDEVLDNIHSLYVDQWDWERTITVEDRNVAFLRKIVRKIYEGMKRTDFYVAEEYPGIDPLLPEDIFFIHSEELLRLYPKKTPKEREDAIAKDKGAVFIIGIGGKLSSGDIHDGRAPDYDDWSTPNEEGFSGLNGDIIVWNYVLDAAFELSSMGIRVDQTALLKQLKEANAEFRKSLYFHKKLLNGELPLSIGGGIGQSRLCMYYLRKAHIGEVQASLWPQEQVTRCRDAGIQLL